MVKMKTGGSVSRAVEEAKMCGGGMSKGGKYKEGGKVHDDEAQDKALIKKELSKFAKEEDKGEKSELKLKSGGRAKKAKGSVKKFKVGGAVDNKPAGDKDTIKKVKAAPKKAEAPSKGAAKPAFKGSDVEKEKSKPAGDQNPIKKVKPTGDKKAAAPNKAAVKPSREGNKNAIDDIDGFAEGGSTGFGRGGATGSQSPIPPSIAAQLMQAQQGAALQGSNPSPMGNPSIPGDNPVMNGNLPQRQAGSTAQPQPNDISQMLGMPVNEAGASQQPFNAYQNFRRANPNAQPGLTPQQIMRVLQSPEFQRSNRNFTDR
jgi:hypothetical protein